MTNDARPEIEAGAVLAGDQDQRTADHRPFCPSCWRSLPSRRRREIEEARRPRPGDHPGGPVAPW